MQRSGLVGLLLGCLCVSSAFAVDAFDRQTSYWVRLAASKQEPVGSLSSGQAAELKLIGPNVSYACIVVQTDEGNFAKALISWGLRKGAERPTPILIIERFVTFDRDRNDQTLATGKNLMLFPGYQFNFDIGQVVPAGQGADVTFTEKRLLEVVEGSKLYPLNGSPIPPAEPTAAPNPHDHEGVLPRDFSGVWKVNADGRWQGRWELDVDDEGRVRGKYVSAETESAYPIRGRVTGEPHRMILDVELAAANLQYEVYLWTTDKNRLAGITTVSDRRFGIYAEREQPAAPAPK